MRSEKEFQEIQDAKAILKRKGYHVANLWQVEDVKGKFKCTDEQAHSVLERALSNEATMDQIWFAIDFHGEDEGLEKIEDNE